MKDLIEALQIFLKYSDAYYPTHCELGVLYIVGVGAVSNPDAKRLGEIGFQRDAHANDWYSKNRFGFA